MKPILNDPNIEPTKDVLQSTLGDNFKNYETLLQTIDRLGLTAEWRYYNDGKSWLCKVLHKKKTAFWLSIWANCFKTTFYFTEKNVEDIAALPVAEAIKSDFCTQKPVGRLLPMIIAVYDSEVLADIETIIKYKMGKR